MSEVEIRAEMEGLKHQLWAAQKELRLLKERNYVTHTVCGSIVETGQLIWQEADDAPKDVAIYVLCPACQDLVEGGEMEGGDSHYLVRKPE